MDFVDKLRSWRLCNHGNGINGEFFGKVADELERLRKIEAAAKAISEDAADCECDDAGRCFSASQSYLTTLNDALQGKVSSEDSGAPACSQNETQVIGASQGGVGTGDIPTPEAGAMRPVCRGEVTLGDRLKHKDGRVIIGKRPESPRWDECWCDKKEQTAGCRNCQTYQLFWGLEPTCGSRGVPETYYWSMGYRRTRSDEELQELLDQQKLMHEKYGFRSDRT